MTVALSEMSRDALVRELRLAYSSRNLSRVPSIKYYIAKKRTPRKMEMPPAVKPRSYVDD